MSQSGEPDAEARSRVAFDVRIGLGGTTARVDDTSDDYSIGLGVAGAVRATGEGPMSFGVGARFFAGSEILGGEAMVGAVVVSTGLRLLPALDIAASMGVAGAYARREYWFSDEVDDMTGVGLLVGGSAALRVYQGTDADLSLYFQHDRTFLDEAPSFMTNTLGLGFSFH